MLYHLSIPGHPVGTIVEPGRWGSIVGTLPGHMWAQAELLLEFARGQLNPAAPSRMLCTFACEDIEGAREFQLKRPGDAIYAAEIVDPALGMHRANVRLLHPDMGHDARFDWRVQAREYWLPTVHGPEPGTEFVAELLVAGPLRLGEVIEGPLSSGL